MSHIPPDQEAVTPLRSLNIDSIHGYWEVYDETMTLTDRDYACVETDTIRGCIDITVHDAVPNDPAFLRSAVMAFEFAYTFPNPDTGEHEEEFTSVAAGFYTCATNEQGENIVTLCGPFMGVNGSVFYHAPLVPGVYGTWITATVHFTFNIWLVYPWTFGSDITVIPCPVGNQPILITVPQPPNPKGGDPIWDTAQLLGGIEPTGDITFKLWADVAETTLIYEEIVGVAGNGSYRTNEVPTPEDVPFPAGLHWHWTAHYSGDDNNNDADSGAEPVDIEAEFGTPSGADQFHFTEFATISGDHPGDIAPGVVRFQATALIQQWFANTKTDITTATDIDDQIAFGPSLANHVAIGGQNYIIEIINQAGAHVYNVTPVVDEISRPMQHIMGVCYNYKNNDLFAAVTPDPLLAHTPHDVDWFPDDTGILAAIVDAPSTLKFRKYSYAGAILDEWVPAIEDGWYLEPVKIAITCDASTVFYTFQKDKIKRYNFATGQLTDYLTLPAYSGYRYGDLQVIRGKDDSTALVVTMTRSGQGPHRGVAVAPGMTAWNDRGHPIDTINKVEKRRLSDLHLLLAVSTGDGDKVLSLACNYNPCQQVMSIIVTLIS